MRKALLHVLIVATPTWFSIDAVQRLWGNVRKIPYGLKAAQIRQILVPIDFSPESLETLQHAILLAKRVGARLHLVHVVTLPPGLPLGHGRQIAAGVLDRLKGLAAEHSLPPDLAQCTVRTGVAADRINEVARESSADLIAISTRGYTGLKLAFLGSTTVRVVRSAPCPVLVIRTLKHPSARQRARRRRTPLQFRKILVPLDFSECSRLGLNYALGFAREFRASLVLFHSVVIQSYALGDEYTALNTPNFVSLQQAYADDEMKSLRKELAGSNLQIASNVTIGSLVERIDEFARANAVDLIIASTHGRSGVHRIFIGSMAEQIVRHAPCSVLIVPNRTARRNPKKRRA